MKYNASKKHDLHSTLTIISIILAALLLSSCSKMVILDGEGAREMKGKKVSRLVRPSQFTGVVAIAGPDGAQPLASDSVSIADDGTQLFPVNFDSATGIIELQNQKVYGHDSLGNERSFSRDQILLMKFKRQGFAARFIDAEQGFASLERAASNRFGDIDFLTEICWEEIVFNSKGGMLDPTSGFVTGTTKTDMEVSVPLSEVRYIVFDLGRPSLAKSFSKNKWKILRGSAVIAVGYFIVNGLSDLTE